jgi:hypothetical protein
MPEELPLSTLLLYCLFSTFVFYQQLHLRDFRGRSKVLEAVLGLFAFAGMITGLGFLGYYGWVIAWWAPIILFVAGLAFQLVMNIVERAVGGLTISLAGFVGWPVCAYFLFASVPGG